MRRYRGLRILKIVLIVIVAVTVMSFVTMSLWNWLMPALFGLRTIGFLQALGLIVLGKILFGGFRGGPGAGGRMRWRRRMAERWEQMSPEEREKFRQGMRGWCDGKEVEPAK
jgi:hypothetical protein